MADPSEATAGPESASPWRGRRLPLAALLAFVCALVVPAVLGGADATQQHRDMVRFHLPRINELLQDPSSWAAPSAVAATAPGHHAVLAAAAWLRGRSAVAPDDLPVRLLNAAAAPALALALWWLLGRWTGRTWRTALLAATVAGSHYVVTSSIWINTDAAALLLYVVALSCAVASPRRPVSTGLALGGLVLWRQMYAPAALAASWLAARRGSPHAHRAAAATGLPAAILLGLLAWTWGGATPPTGQATNTLGLYPIGLLHGFALLGLLTVPFAGFARGGPLPPRAVLAWSALLALGLWLAVPSVPDPAAGRWASLVWTLAEASPGAGSRTLSTLLLAWLGLVAFWVVGRAGPDQELAPEALLLLGCLAGASLQPFAWQRYAEPAILVTLAVASARRAEGASRWSWLGPLGFLAAYSTATQLRVWGVVGPVVG